MSKTFKNLLLCTLTGAIFAYAADHLMSDRLVWGLVGKQQDRINMLQTYIAKQALSCPDPQSL